MKSRSSPLLCLALVGCGSGAPLLHPAHALPPEHVTMGAGVSSAIVTGDAKSKITAARAAMADGAVDSDTERQAFVTGALGEALLAPGLAPWVGARAGIAQNAEAGITYTARSARLDGRYSLASGNFAASGGLGASGVLAHPSHDAPGDARGGSDERIPGLDIGGLSGFGVDLPLLVGFRSQGSLFQVWAGARGGYERLRGKALLRIGLDPTASDEAPFEAERWFVLGVLGLGATFHPVNVAFELDAGYQTGSGSIQLEDPSGRKRWNGELEGFTLSPAAAVIVELWD